MSALQINDDLSRVEREFAIEIGHLPKAQISRKLGQYDQFEENLRNEASRMSEMYEVFYCLENSIRKLVAEVMKEAAGVDWWFSSRVNDDKIRKQAAERRQKEVDSAVTPRSDDMIDYTTFGELSQLITDNWDIFDPVFSSNRALK